MEQRLHIEEVFKVDGYGLIIYFSDHTFARYTVDEISRLRPAREPIEKAKKVQNTSELQ